MATFVIVHGAFGGAWEWREVASLLHARGHEVFTPSLTGHAERVHLATSETGLATHIEDVLNLLRYEELDNVVLAGQSYGGMVVTGVADRVPERLAHLVFVDALVPEDGQCVFDLLPSPIRTRFEEGAQASDGFCVPSLPFEDDPRVAAFARGRYVASPLKMFAEPIRLTRPPDPRLGRTYIWCTEDQTGLPSGFSEVTWPFAERARDDPSWTLHQLTAMHDVFIDLPETVADIFESAAS